MSKISSDVFILPIENNLSRELIESSLAKHYNDIVRWAIVNFDDNKLKISVSYKKD